MAVTNMKVLKKSRKRPRPGDIFVLQIEEGHFRFGRVIRVDARIGPLENCVLVYIFRASSQDKHQIPELSKDDLLVPPVMTNCLPWSKGYFEVVEHRPLHEQDILPIHCFLDCMFRHYYDDDGKRLPYRSEPCGVHGLAGYGAIDDDVSRALGVPLAPEDEGIPNVLEGGMTIAMNATDMAQAGLTERAQIEDALGRALTACKLGQVTGGGRGVSEAHVEVLAVNEAKLPEALQVVKSTLRELRLPESTRIYLPGEQVHNLYD
jgi:hypothetical protein